MLRHVVVKGLELRLLLMLLLLLVLVVRPSCSVIRRHRELERQLHVTLRVVIVALEVLRLLLLLLMSSWHELLLVRTLWEVIEEFHLNLGLLLLVSATSSTAISTNTCNAARLRQVLMWAEGLGWRREQSHWLAHMLLLLLRLRRA